jgi:hypothetical protein
MPEALPVLFVMKIAKNQVDTPVTILTCMHSILVTRGIISSMWRRGEPLYQWRSRENRKQTLSRVAFKDLQNAYCNDVICSRSVYKDVSLVQDLWPYSLYICNMFPGIELGRQSDGYSRL